MTATLRGTREAAATDLEVIDDRSVAPRGKVGRPYLFDPVAGLRVVELLRAGNFFETAAGAAGVSVRTLRNWRRAGKRFARTRHPAPSSAWAALGDLGAMLAAPSAHMERWLAGFSAACEVAEAEAEVVPLLIWRKAMQENPALAAKFLERRYPTRWGAQPTTAVQVNTGGGSALTIIAPPEEEP